MMTRVLVLWAQKAHPNIGVVALAEGAAAWARMAFGPDVDVSFQATGPDGDPYNDGPMSVSQTLPLIKERFVNKRGLKDWVKSFDLVLDTRAGDSFADIYGVKRLAKMTPIGYFAHQWKVPTVLAPQTIGPFVTPLGKILGKFTLETTDVVMARDPYSAHYAASLRRPVDHVTTDLVFALEHQQLEKKYDVLLNVSGLLWDENPHVDFTFYRETIYSLIEELGRRGRTVTLFPHVFDNTNNPGDNDGYPNAELRSLVDGRILKPEGLMGAREAVGQAQLVIGSRMHACLNALSMYTPALPLAYSRKFGPLLSHIGWDHNFDLRQQNFTAAEVADLTEAQDALTEQAYQTRQNATRLLTEAAGKLQELL